MDTRSGVVKYFEQDFLLDEPKLRKIVDVLKEQSKKLSYETYLEFYVEREGDVFYTTRHLDEVLKDENTTGKSIRLMTIELYRSVPEPVEKQRLPEERKAIVYIAFSPDSKNKVRITVTCEDRDWTFLTADEIESQIKRITNKSNIRFLKYSDFVLAILIIYLGISVSSWLYPSLEMTSADITSLATDTQIEKILEIVGNRDTNSIYLFVVPWTVSMFGCLFLILTRPILNMISKSRTSFFYWGDMVQHHDKIERRNNLIVSGIILAGIVSVAGSVVGTLILHG